jgi:cardiolipin synthase
MGIESQGFFNSLVGLTGTPFLDGNRVEILNNGDEFYPSMLEAIAAARYSITVEAYIYWAGDIGLEFAKALAARARDGVSVKILLDAVGSATIGTPILAELESGGCQVAWFNPPRWHGIGWLNHRTHRKSLVVDGRIGFTGGVGIADQWLGRAQDPDHWRDTHFRIEGPAVAQMQAAFNDNWIKTTGEVLNGETYFPPLTATGDVDAHVFIASPSGGSESMHLMYMMAVTAATRSLDLAAAYFVPDGLIVKALLAARQRGVRIRILLPGQHIDADSVRAASKAGWEPLLQAGIEIHEYQPTMLHTKLLVIDDEFVSVGSTNFDIRSFRLNDEASLNLYDRAFAAKMTAAFEADLSRAKRYTVEAWRQRPLKEKLIERFVLPFKSQL